MKAKDVKFRASQMGALMTNPRSKNDLLSKTCMTAVQDLFLEIEFGIRKEFRNKYTDKGHEVEKQSIDLANRALDLKINTETDSSTYRFNDWVHGTTDAESDELILDVKSSWDISTFPIFETEMPNKHYRDQLQCYMWLSGRELSVLAYCLIDTPEDIILDEIRREHWVQNSYWNGDEDPAIEEYVRSKHQPKIPEHLRIKHWFIEKDEHRIEEFKQRITECRAYYNGLLKEFNLPDAE